MEVPGFGCVEKIKVPDDWTIDQPQATALLKLSTFHPAASPEIELSMFQKLQGVDATAMEQFRKILDKPAHTTIDTNNELLQLTPILGNVGNNQWTNKAKGLSGPNFRFISGEIQQLNLKPVLRVKGQFIEPESRKSINEYCGVFIDSGAERNLVQEIYLQVPSHYGYFKFEQYMKVFEQALSSVLWK